MSAVLEGVVLEGVEYEFNIEEDVIYHSGREVTRFVYSWVREEQRNSDRFDRLVETRKKGYPMEHIKALRKVKREVPREPVVIVEQEERFEIE